MDFLSELERENYEEPLTEKELLKNQKENEKMSKKEEKQREQERKRLEKILMKQPIIKHKEEVVEEPTDGVDKIRLQIRIKKYIELFPDEY